MQALNLDVTGTVADAVMLANLPKTPDDAHTLALNLLRKGAGGQSRVASLYRSLLGREPDTFGLNGYLPNLGNGADILELARDLAAAPEFARHWQA